MQRMEVLFSVFLAALSLFLMWGSAKLPVLWVARENTLGGGAFGFWLSFGMLICALISLSRAWRAYWGTQSDVSLSNQGRVSVFWRAGGDTPFFQPFSEKILAINSLLLVALVVLTPIISIYAAIFLFLLCYLRGIGKYSWFFSFLGGLLSSILLFYFFDKKMLIYMPKGVSFIEELYYVFY